MMGRAGDATRRPMGVDLSRKTALVGRGFRSRAAGAGLRTRGEQLLSLLWRLAGFFTSAGVVAWLLAGGPSFPLDGVDYVPAGWLALMLGLRVWRRLSRVSKEKGDKNELEEDIDLCLLSVVAAHTVIVFTGGMASPVRPLLYLVVAVLVVFHRPAVAIVTVAAALGIELALAFFLGHLSSQAVAVGVHGAFIAGFAVFYHLALSGSVASSRAKTRSAIESQLRDLRRRAREYRLIVSSSDPGLEVQGGNPGREKWIAAAVEQVEGAMRSGLEVVECALRTHTVALYLLSPDERSLRLRECLSASDHVSRQPVAAGEGLPGVVLRGRAPVRLCGSFRGAIYYRGGVTPKAFLGVPLIERRPDGPEEGHLRGVLIADRVEAEPFEEEDERLLTMVAGELLRAMEVERVMGYIREEKDEKVRFYRAIEALNVLSKPEEVCSAVTRLATELAPLDFVAVTLVEEGEEPGSEVRHRVAEVFGRSAGDLKGRVFEDNAGLVANVVRLGSPLPGRDFHDMDRKMVFSEAERVTGLQTLKVLPMLVGENVVGTLVCGAQRKGALMGDSVRQLSVLAMQAAGAISRAKLFEQTEKMATTDGLTGLNNHRRFQECMDAAMASSRRYEGSCSLILSDVDHFKGVNDTYGHPVGDLVLKGVARILQSEARDTDVVARYGGEEFAVILPQTDAEGARVIAERIRCRIEEEIFQTEVGPLRVTISMGIAGFPRHGEHKQELIEKADQALYAAKESGRNRVVIAR